MSYGEYCKHCRHYPQSHEKEGCRAGWDKDSKYQPKLPEGKKYHCDCALEKYEAA
jgi:hypothetical protein